MRRSLLAGIVVVCSLAGGIPGHAQEDEYRNYRRYRPDNAFKLWLGVFSPEGDSEYWQGRDAEFLGASTDDLEDAVGGIDFSWNLGDGPLAIALSGSWFETTQDTQYRNFEDNFGDPIEQSMTLEVAPFTAGLVVRIAPDGSPIVPYIGAGGGIYTWRLEESGDFIDFTRPSRPIFTDTLTAEGVALGYYGALGIEVPFSNNVGFFAEGRVHRADDELGDDFEGLGKIDLSGTDLHAGIVWSF